MIPGCEVLLAVEVISPGSGSERNDRVRKVREYASVGIPQYWIVEHSPAPRVQILTLDGRSYAADPATASGVLVVTEIDADKSFTVSFDPATLLEF